MACAISSLFILFFLLFSFPLSAQSAVSLTAEISRLERISLGAAPRDRYDAFMSLALLHRLSGNPEAALKACEGALALYPRDGKALLEQGRLLISLGEYDKAAAAAIGLLRPDQETAIFLQGRYLSAQAEAFRSGNVQALAALADEPEFSEYRSAIYYTIWRLTGNPSWGIRLGAELPLSPEAKIAGGKALFAPTPLWLLFPGRESISISPSPADAAEQPPVSQPEVSQPPVSQSPALQTSLLQTGLFTREENAQTQAESLKKAGFTPVIFLRNVNGVNHWAVGVPYGSDMNPMITKLKDAGFESFPVNL